jgi:glucosylceramidase
LKVIGFGFSESFRWSSELHGSPGLSLAGQPQVLDPLFSPHLGTGFTILLTIIGSSPDTGADHVPIIEPHRSGAPSGTPEFVRDNSDQRRIWRSHGARRFSVTQGIADAWSAPGYLETNAATQRRNTQWHSRRDPRRGGLALYCLAR